MIHETKEWFLTLWRDRLLRWTAVTTYTAAATWIVLDNLRRGGFPIRPLDLIVLLLIGTVQAGVSVSTVSFVRSIIRPRANGPRSPRRG